jgi:hypothetical protein
MVFVFKRNDFMHDTQGIDMSPTASMTIDPAPVGYVRAALGFIVSPSQYGGLDFPLETLAQYLPQAPALQLEVREALMPLLGSYACDPVTDNKVAAVLAQTDSGGAQAVMTWVEAQRVERQQELLIMPYMLWRLAERGQAAPIMGWVKRQETAETQIMVMSAPDAVWGLTKNGQDAAVLDWLEQQNLEHQAKVLAAPHAVWGLAMSGRAEDVVRLLEPMSSGQQQAVLSADYASEGLGTIGYQQAEIDTIKASWRTRPAPPGKIVGMLPATSPAWRYG